MKIIVIYQSATGFTAKYASWLAEALGCEAKELKKTNAEELAGYDKVVFGGWLMAGMVSGYNKVKSFGLKDLVVFGVGMSVPNEEIIKTITEQNGIDAGKFFYFEGGYDPKKVNFIKRLMMNMIKKSVEKKAEKTEDDYHVLETFKGKDNCDINAIKPLVAFVRG